MSTDIQSPKRTIINLLSRADRFNRLAKLCPSKHQEVFYRLKDAGLDQAIRIAPEEFVVDSVGGANNRMFGVTHTPSGRRAHLRPAALSVETQVHLRRLATAKGFKFTVSRSNVTPRFRTPSTSQGETR